MLQFATIKLQQNPPRLKVYCTPNTDKTSNSNKWLVVNYIAYFLQFHLLVEVSCMLSFLSYTYHIIFLTFLMVIDTTYDSTYLYHATCIYDKKGVKFNCILFNVYGRKRKKKQDESNLEVCPQPNLFSKLGQCARPNEMIINHMFINVLFFCLFFIRLKIK